MRSRTPLLVFGRDKQEYSAHKVDEDERADTKGNSIGLGALVYSPAMHRHGNAPCQRNNKNANAYADQQIEDEGYEPQGLV